MKTLALLLLSIFAVTGYAQGTDAAFDGHTWEAPYDLPAPKGWMTERFPIPISFAPQIPYKGVEDLRFAPGWAKAKGDEYWSYAFLWYLEGKVKINSGILDSNLQAYYTGLIANNAPNIPADKVIPVTTSFKEIKKGKGDLNTYAGTISMTDYMQKKPITLNCKVHLRYIAKENKTFVFYELSPQPLAHNIWRSLDKLWVDFKIKKG